MAPQATVVSFRLGGSDGVAVEARKWSAALGDLGFEVRRVAGEIDAAVGDDDVVIPGLAIDAPEPVDPGALHAALEGSDLVVVENACSLPLNLAASEALAAELSRHGGRVVLRHHDLPWQRRNLLHLEQRFPPRVDGALHATINLRSRRELEARGYEGAVTVHNYFDLDAAPGEREATRAAFGFGDDDVVLLQPSRAIERKNVPGGVRFASAIARLLRDRTVRFWLTGPAEDGYGPTLDRVLARSEVEVTTGRAASAADAYAACDAVVFPSTWEGFGNPTIESIVARRPLAAFPYPVLSEIAACGLKFFSTDDPEALARFLAAPKQQFFDTNLHRARLSFSISELPAAIEAAFATRGWRKW